MGELNSNPDLSSSNTCALDHSCSLLWGLSPLSSAPASWPSPLAPRQLQRPLKGLLGHRRGDLGGGEETVLRSWPPAGLNVGHSLGLAVGDHADNAHYEQSHADAGDSQDPLLVQLLGFCTGRGQDVSGQGSRQICGDTGAKMPSPLPPKLRLPPAQGLPAPLHLLLPQLAPPSWIASCCPEICPPTDLVPSDYP